LAHSLEAALAELQTLLDGLVREIVRHPGSDGSARLLLRLSSDRTVEAVELPRDGLCVSTQVGCAVGCRFCKTGESGLIAQLSALEILAQVAHVRRTRPLRRVVFMGMGEPSHNLAAVLDAVTALGEHGRLPHKNLVFSTVGEPRVFEQLHGNRVRPALALSLHTLDAALRADLLPRAPSVAPEVLLAAALDYADRTTYPLLLQWTLLAGVNDDIDGARALAALLRGRRAIVNYIPFNAVEGSGWERPPIERCVELVRTLKGAGVMATLRHSAGQDVDGGCGQLRARQLSS
jgi:23S rRNA (adenine2503-C2)-methyltransferase